MLNKIVKNIKRKAVGKIMAGLCAVSFLAIPQPAARADDGAAAGVLGALGAVAAYNGYFKQISAMGNNAYYQEETYLMDVREHGLSRFRQDKIVVDRVMKQLAARGDYTLESRNLPFRWAVNDSNEFNAACYPTNYISINRGLVAGLRGDEDELAAVLGHEMIHGLRLHAASNVAKAAAAQIGMMAINAATNAGDPGMVAMMTDYGVAKMVSVPTEYEADEGGFYIACSAGFNPGGAAAAMVRMENITNREAEFHGKYDPYDHPETPNREKKLSQMMTEYSAGHVKVDKNKIFIDDMLFAETDWTDLGGELPQETAYLVAGAIARGLHDNNNLTSWNWRPSGRGDGLEDYLNDDRVYEPLKTFVTEHHLERELKKLITAAYTAEVITDVRTKMQEADEARHEKWMERLAKTKLADRELVTKFVDNGDAYNDVYLPGYARQEAVRAFDCVNLSDDLSKIYAVVARACMQELDFEEAEKNVEYALKLNPDSAFNHVTRADIYRGEGRPEEAIAECRAAIACDGKFAPAYGIAGDIADELGDEELALSFYREHKRLEPKANGYHMKYLEKLDPRAAEEIREAQKKRAEEWAKELPTKEQKLKKQEEEKLKKEKAGSDKQEKGKNKSKKAKDKKEKN
ncbi:MAG: M48 family metalloprotease [Selenomonadaceae bacterium]|nr:M48 family metalloprotease [Selenomonadaceae bacterium]